MTGGNRIHGCHRFFSEVMEKQAFSGWVITPEKTAPENMSDKNEKNLDNSLSTVL
jgi:hypothetical protein